MHPRRKVDEVNKASPSKHVKHNDPTSEFTFTLMPTRTSQPSSSIFAQGLSQGIEISSLSQTSTRSNFGLRQHLDTILSERNLDESSQGDETQDSDNPEVLEQQDKDEVYSHASNVACLSVDCVESGVDIPKTKSQSTSDQGGGLGLQFNKSASSLGSVFVGTKKPGIRSDSTIPVAFSLSQLIDDQSQKPKVCHAESQLPLSPLQGGSQADGNVGVVSAVEISRTSASLKGNMKQLPTQSDSGSIPAPSVQSHPSGTTPKSLQAVDSNPFLSSLPPRTSLPVVTTAIASQVCKIGLSIKSDTSTASSPRNSLTSSNVYSKPRSTFSPVTTESVSLTTFHFSSPIAVVPSSLALKLPPCPLSISPLPLSHQENYSVKPRKKSHSMPAAKMKPKTFTECSHTLQQHHQACEEVAEAISKSTQRKLPATSQEGVLSSAVYYTSNPHKCTLQDQVVGNTIVQALPVPVPSLTRQVWSDTPSPCSSHESAASPSVKHSKPPSTLSSERTELSSHILLSSTAATPCLHTSDQLLHQGSAPPLSYPAIKPHEGSCSAEVKQEASTECSYIPQQAELLNTSTQNELLTSILKGKEETHAVVQSSDVVNAVSLYNFSLPNQEVGSTLPGLPMLCPPSEIRFSCNFCFLPAFNAETVSKISSIEHNWSVDISVLTRMHGRVSLENFVREIDFSTELPLIRHFFEQLSVLRPSTMWVVYDETGHRFPLSAEENAHLTLQYYPGGEASIGNCAVNFASMTITENETGLCQQIRQLKPMWHYSKDNTLFSPISEPGDWEKIEDVMLFGSSTPLLIGGSRCVIDFDTTGNNIPAVLIDVKSGQKCFLKRDPPISSPVVHGFELHFKGSDELATARAMEEVGHELNMQLISKEVDVSSVDPIVRCFLYQLARQYCVEVSLSAALTAIQVRGTGQVYLSNVIIKLQNALLDARCSVIQSAMISIQQEITDSNDLSRKLPEEWEPQTSTVQVFPLSRGTPEWSRVEKRMCETMPTVSIHKILRIQNEWLWKKYVQHKEMLYTKNNGKINELDLFHGTRSNEPKNIYDGDEGFDMRYSASGMWGQANYFAMNANYSNSYAHQTSNGCKEMFLAKVLTGESHKCPPNSSLRKPPVKPGGATASQVQLSQVNYDTVTGHTGGSQVYMAYDNLKAYPAYLICYS